MAPADDQKFERALETFRIQVDETTQFWFAAATMNEVAKRPVSEDAVEGCACSNPTLSAILSITTVPGREPVPGSA